MTPTALEIEALQMLAGLKPVERGAWLNACVEFLSAMGLVNERTFEVTEKGHEFLKARADENLWLARIEKDSADCALVEQEFLKALDKPDAVS